MPGQPRPEPARFAVRHLRLQRPADGAVNKNAPSHRRHGGDRGLRALGRPAAHLPVDRVRRIASHGAGGLPLQGGLPRCGAAGGGGGRADGGRERRQGQGQGARSRRAANHRRDRDRPPLRPDQARRPRDAAAEEPARGDLRRDRTGSRDGARPSRRRLAAARARPADRPARRHLQRLRRAHPAQLPGLAARVGHRHLGHLRERLQRLAGQRRAVLRERRQGPAPARRPGRGPAAARAQHRPRLRRRLGRTGTACAR